MTTVFQPARDAHAAWLRTDDQLYLDVDAITSSAAGTTSTPGTAPGDCVPGRPDGEGRPAAHTTERSTR